jgi:hypothetical protein
LLAHSIPFGTQFLPAFNHCGQQKTLSPNSESARGAG